MEEKTSFISSKSQRNLCLPLVFFRLLEEDKCLLPFLAAGADTIGQEPKETGSTFVASNINGVIECIDYIISFPSI